MRVAGFKDQPQANSAATILREHGYEADVIAFDGETAPDRLDDLPDTVRDAHWANAFVLSNCDSEYFRQVVITYSGTVIWQHRRR